MEKPSLSLKDTGRIYLDHNATTKPHDTVYANITEWLGFWGNPSSIHWSGRGPKNIIRDTRQRLASHLRCHPLEIIFTGGGSEANNAIIKGFFENAIQRRSTRDEYITTGVEHPSVLESFEYLKSRGAKVHYLKVNRSGEIDFEQYQSLLGERTALVSVMFANNETGSIFPVKKMAKMAHAVGAKFHTDAVQALGKHLLDINAMGVDYASFSGHKMYALKGVGAMYVKKGERLVSLISGGGQERGRRAGTENVLAIASLGQILKLSDQVGDHVERMTRLRDRLENDVKENIPGSRLTGASRKRLCNTSSFVFDDVDGESLLMNLDLHGVSVSTGAACSSGSPEPSPVLLAMGLSRAEAQGSLRVSLGWETTEDDIFQFGQILKSVITRLRRIRSDLRQKENLESDGSELTECAPG